MRWLKYYQFLSEKNILWFKKFSFAYIGLTSQTFRNDENLSYYGFNKSLHMTRTALRALSLQKYWVLSIARARCKLKQLCCYINPDFSVKMSDVSEYSDSEFYYPKKTKTNKKGKVLCSYDKMLIDWVRSGRTGKYLALGHSARTSLRSVRTPWPRAKYFPVRPSHSVNKYI